MTFAWPVGPWLLAWAGGVLLFFGSLFAAFCFIALRSLRRKKIPHPLSILVRLSLTVLPLRSGSVAALEGRDAFVAWDRRWLDAGETLATIRRVNDITQELELALRDPIGNARLVTFKPRDTKRAPYRWSAVRGTLAPAIDGVTPTALVVVITRSPAPATQPSARPPTATGAG